MLNITSYGIIKSRKNDNKKTDFIFFAPGILIMSIVCQKYPHFTKCTPNVPMYLMMLFIYLRTFAPQQNESKTNTITHKKQHFFLLSTQTQLT